LLRNALTYMARLSEGVTVFVDRALACPLIRFLMG
jgi:hypothetical protein